MFILGFRLFFNPYKTFIQKWVFTVATPENVTSFDYKCLRQNQVLSRLSKTLKCVPRTPALAVLWNPILICIIFQWYCILFQPTEEQNTYAFSNNNTYYKNKENASTDSAHKSNCRKYKNNFFFLSSMTLKSEEVLLLIATVFL